MTDFLVYWRQEQIAEGLRRGSLPHAASSQYSRVSRGDRVWISGCQNGGRELFTIGFIDVASILNERSAQTEMRRRISDYTVWSASHHILAARGKESEARALSLKPMYGSLTFESTSSTRLALSDGHPNAQQLQRMRTLTSVAADKLSQYWEKTKSVLVTREQYLEESVDLDKLDAQRITMARLEQIAARKLLLQGRLTGACAFCGRTIPAALLVAAHIKPRSECTDAEKRQIRTNIVGLCKLGCDDLFERGYVEVFDGVIIAGSAKPVTVAVSECVASIANRRVQGWTQSSEAFYGWRRNNRSK